MKTKTIFMLAAMLLMSMGAFAQSGNNTPAKGDVNNDGTVDVADIVAVIDIMKNGGGTATVGYFYLGTTEPTAENYKTLPGVVTTYTSFDAAVGTSASVAAGETLYLLCPAAWMEEKTPTLEDKDGNSISFLDEKDEITISDYVIYKTQVWNTPNDVVLKAQETYYLYVGTEKPTSLSQAQVVTSYPTELTFDNPNTSKCYVYVLTNLNKTVNFYDPVFPTIAGTKMEDITSIQGYKITTPSGDGVNPSKLSVNGSIIIRIS